MKFIAWLVAGLVLGPSLLNVSIPGWYGPISQFAGGLFLFFAGWEMRFLDLRREARFYSIVFLGTFLFPLVAGYFLLERNFFLAAAVSISALPVAIQILKEKNLYDSDLARKTITLASLCDIFAWVLMAFLFPSKDLQGWLLNHWIVFAFFLGLIFGQLVRWRPRLALIQMWVFAPVFFIGLGWKIDLFHLFSFSTFLRIFLVAIVMKGVGTYISARLGGHSKSEAWDLSSLLNARGAMEILAANFAYSAGLIDGSIFAALVALGVVTSVMAVPMIRQRSQTTGVVA